MGIFGVFNNKESWYFIKFTNYLNEIDFDTNEKKTLEKFFTKNEKTFIKKTGIDTMKTSDVFNELIDEILIKDDLVLVEKVMEKIKKDFENYKIYLINEKLSKKYYEKRNENESYITKCIEISQSEIENFRKIKKHIKRKENKKYCFPCFSRLVSLYERKKDFKSAIKICDLAIKNRIDDEYGKGFEIRKEKLLKYNGN